MRKSSQSNQTEQIALIVSLRRPGEESQGMQASAEELKRLAEGLGYMVPKVLVRSAATAPRKIYAEGLLEEIEQSLSELQGLAEPDSPVHLLVDGTLLPSEERRLSQRLELPVLDRVGVVLEVFRRRARTPLSKLEVELASLRYELPRVRDDRALSGREGGGGRGGRGHTNVELRKQQIRERMAQLAREIQQRNGLRVGQTALRRDKARVSLVGYTNAGKSCLMRQLTGSEVLVQDALFATLDATVRRMQPVHSASEILVADTVGFMRRLPAELVSSFESTLAEAREADLLLLVADASDPDWRAQLEVTSNTLSALGVSDIPQRIVLNKADRLSEAERRELIDAFPEAFLLSAQRPEEVRVLRVFLETFFDGEPIEAALQVPYSQGALLAEVRAQAEVLSELYQESSVELCVRAYQRSIYAWLNQLRGERPPAGLLEILAAVSERGLRLDTSSAEIEELGLDFQVVFANDERGSPWVVRAGRREACREILSKESQILSFVAQRLSISVPEYRVKAPELVAYPRLSGTPYVQVKQGEPAWLFSPQELPPELFESLATLLLGFRGLSAVEARGAGLLVEELADARREARRVVALANSMLDIPGSVQACWAAWLADDSNWDGEPTFVHGDLHPGHWLADERGALTGVIDFSEGKFSDAGIDLAMIYGCLGAAAYARLAEVLASRGYPEQLLRVERVRARWRAFPAFGLAYAVTAENQAVIAYAEAEIQRLADELAAVTD